MRSSCQRNAAVLASTALVYRRGLNDSDLLGFARNKVRKISCSRIFFKQTDESGTESNTANRTRLGHLVVAGLSPRCCRSGIRVALVAVGRDAAAGGRATRKFRRRCKSEL